MTRQQKRKFRKRKARELRIKKYGGSTLCLPWITHRMYINAILDAMR